jgi:MoxR-like ATPase
MVEKQRIIFLKEKNIMENLDFKNRINIDKLNETASKIKEEISKVILGQEEMIEQILVAILSDGHILIEGVPGVAKTLTAKLFANIIDADFSRIQFTPDLMPSDIIGTSIFNMNKSEFEFKKGPVFGDIILIDEINRSPAKTQAALFEIMEERQITYDGITYKMDDPFIVLATQNPIEHEGTYRLPEAQLDRFLFKINVSYPNFEKEVQILENYNTFAGNFREINLKSIVSKSEIVEFKNVINSVLIDSQLIRYITQIVTKTRNNNAIYLGASPRASINLMKASKTFAAVNGRDFVIPDDIKAMVYPTLRHRIILTPEKEMEGIDNDRIIKQIVDSVEVPR